MFKTSDKYVVHSRDSSSSSSSAGDIRDNRDCQNFIKAQMPTYINHSRLKLCIGNQSVEHPLQETRQQSKTFIRFTLLKGFTGNIFLCINVFQSDIYLELREDRPKSDVKSKVSKCGWDPLSIVTFPVPKVFQEEHARRRTLSPPKENGLLGR